MAIGAPTTDRDAPRGALALRGLVRRFANARGVLGRDGAGVTLDVRAGEIVAIVGPSGCGKSTLLRVIAGLDVADAGSIAIDGRDVTRAEPHDRGIGMTFDDGALYEHLTVRGNIELGAERAIVARGERDAAIAGAAGRAGAGHLLDRRPASLSAGERRRVALARALARRPSLFLLDEPLTHLDRSARVDLREDLAMTIRATGSAALLVTHDHDDAVAVATRVAFMSDGDIVQVGTAQELVDRPAHVAVARGFGAQPMNIVGTPSGCVGVRPGDCRVGEGAWSVTGAVRFARAGEVTVGLETGERVRVRSDAAPGERVTVSADADRLHRFDRSGLRVPGRESDAASPNSR